jgi:hypothetical protein
VDAPPQRADGEGALMARMLDGRVAMPTANSIGTGPWLTLKDYVALAKAPRRNTQVTVRSFDVPSGWSKALTGRPLKPDVKAHSPDHMFVEYDDGQEQFIARGGPRGVFLNAQINPARRSPDYGRGERVLFQTTLPGQSARRAIRPAQEAARQINGSGQPYLVFGSNSNSFVGDLTEAQFGRRIGDIQTPGYRPWPLPTSSPVW